MTPAKRLSSRALLLSLCFAASLLSSSCSGLHRRRAPALEAVDPIVRSANVPMAAPAVERDLAAVKGGGTLTVLTPYNSTSYFIYRGEPLGYEYELLQAFAREQGVELKMVVVADPKSLLPLLNSGEGDIAKQSSDMSQPLNRGHGHLAVGRLAARP